MEKIIHLLERQLGLLLSKFEISHCYLDSFRTTVLVAIVIILSILVNFLTKKVLLTAVIIATKKSKTVWDDILLEKKVFERLAKLAPCIFIYWATPHIISGAPDIVGGLQRVVESFMVFFVAYTLDAFLNAVHTIYLMYPFSKQKPIKGYIQVVKILIYFISGIIILSILFDKSVVYFFSGLGALAAVLMLIFKDSIMGLVSGIQLSSNNMLKPGDYITMPKHNVDGSVTEISLHTVKVENWDKSIVTIPTYALISESFQNWKGIEEAGCRRIKRSLLIDIKTIQVVNSDLQNAIKQLPIMKAFIEESQKSNPSILSEMTNIGYLRKYIELCLRAEPSIKQDAVILVRTLQPTENGLPIEVSAFCTETVLINFENIQSRFFEHVVAVVGVFGLQIFQRPSGHDFAS